MSTEARRLALQCRLLTRQADRRVLLVCGLRPGAGVSSLVQAAARGLLRERESVLVLDARALEAPPPALPETVVLVDGGALLAAGGPHLDPAWRELVAGVLLVVVADEDRLVELDEARALLEVLELPALALIFNERARVPVAVTLRALWSRLRTRLPRRRPRGAALDVVEVRP